MKHKYLFFIWSNFHLILCKNIIIQNGCNIEDCFFITRRGVKLDEGLKKAPIWMNRFIKSSNSLKKIVHYIWHKDSIDKFVKDSILELFYPFIYKFPKYDFVKVNFIEEGFSSYARNRNVSYNKVNQYKKLSTRINEFLTGFFLKFLDDDVKSLYVGLLLTEDYPLYETQFYTLSPQAYEHIQNDLIKKNVISKRIIPSVTYKIPEGTYFLILDRFSKGGRPYSLDNYMKCIEKEINWLENNKVSKAFVKFHPVDVKAGYLKDIFFKFAKCLTVDFTEFNGNLEYLALQNVGLTFVGTNSTILYYAPILGNKNQSVSFSRYLASVDDDYKRFMESFGGIDNFTNIFSQQVKCQ